MQKIREAECLTIEDDRVAERGLEIWQNVEKYIKHVLKEPKNKQPTSASYSTIQKATKDVLVPAKLQIFVYISKVLKPFLVKYQTDEPMIMFLAEDLHDMCGKLMHKSIENQIWIQQIQCINSKPWMSWTRSITKQQQRLMLALQPRLPMETL